MSNYNRLKVTQNQKTRSTTLHLERRNRRGFVSRQRFTMNTRAFERALLDADVIAPWNKVTK